MREELRNLTSFTAKARPAEKGDTASAETAWQGQGGRDPPLEEQLRPLDLDELIHRIEQVEGPSEPFFAQ